MYDMEANIKNAIDALYKLLEPLLEDEKFYKRKINELSLKAGETPPFPDIDSEGTGNLANIAPDQFYGKPLVPSVRDILKAKGRAMPGREIYDILKRGGAVFEGKDDAVKYRGFTIALSKRSETFEKIPNSDSYGLREWYPELKKAKKAKPEEPDLADISDVKMPSRAELKRLAENNDTKEG
jgi:hypothetical protein